MLKGKYIVCEAYREVLEFSNEINRDGKFVREVSEHSRETGVPLYFVAYEDEEGNVQKDEEYNSIIHYGTFDKIEDAIKKCDRMNEEECGILYIDALAKEFKLLRKIYADFREIEESEKEEDKERLKLWSIVRSEANKKIKEELFLGENQTEICIIETLAEMDMKHEKSIFNSSLYLSIAGEFGVSYYKNCLPTLCKDCKQKKIKLI